MSTGLSNNKCQIAYSRAIRIYTSWDSQSENTIAVLTYSPTNATITAKKKIPSANIKMMASLALSYTYIN